MRDSRPVSLCFLVGFFAKDLMAGKRRIFDLVPSGVIAPNRHLCAKHSQELMFILTKDLGTIKL